MRKDTSVPNDKLRNARLDRSWTLETAAQRAGIGFATYSRWEYGVQQPHLSSLLLLCEAFGMPAEALGFGHLVGEQDGGGEGAQSETVIRLTAQQVSDLLCLIQPGEDNMAHLDMKRRTLLLTLLGLGGSIALAPLADSEPWERLVRAGETPLNMNRETLETFERLTSTCWELSNGGELALVEELLPKFLPRLKRVALQSSPLQTKAASIVSQALSLSSIVAAHKLDLATKEALCRESVTFSKLAEHDDTRAAALIEYAVALDYRKNPKQALQLYLEAMQYSYNATPLLRSRLYVQAAEAFAQCGRKKEALSYLGMAQDAYLEWSKSDPLPLTDVGPGSLALYSGLLYLDIQQPQHAWNAFEALKQDRTGLPVPERIRLEILNHQGRAAIALGDLDGYISCLEHGLTGAVSLRSKKRYNEAVTILREEMPAQWSKEKPMKSLLEQYKLRR